MDSIKESIMNFSFFGPALQIVAEIEAANVASSVGVNVPITLPEIRTYLGKKHVKMTVTIEALP